MCSDLSALRLDRSRPLREQIYPMVRTLLLTGVIKQPDGTLSAAEPVAWTRDYKASSGKTSRIFYTSLGPKEDFSQSNFQKLLANAVKWGAER